MSKELRQFYNLLDLINKTSGDLDPNSDLIKAAFDRLSADEKHLCRLLVSDAELVEIIF